MANDAAATIRELLDQYGLGSLMQWALRQIQLGHTDTEIIQSLRNQPEFEARFPAIKERERQGLPPISPGQYVEYERSARQLMRYYNLPPGLFDTPDDFTALLSNDVSLEELNARVTDGYARVQALPQEVKQWFGDKYGPKADSMLAALYMDPDKATPELMKETQAAVVGGTGRRFGFEVGTKTAELVGQTGASMAEVQQGFEQLNATRDLYKQSISEQNVLDAEVQGVRATFGTDGEAQAQVRDRQRRRQASFAGQGQYASGQTGVTGLGRTAPA